MSIAYFAHELADPAVQKRVRMLVAAGSDVRLLGFERRRFNNNAQTLPKPHVLGRTENGKLVSRIFSVLMAIPRAMSHGRAWMKADALLARNLEMLVIVSVLKAAFRLRARVIYECLDLHRLVLAQGRKGRIVRWIERQCLKGVSLVVTSSPAFDARYFRAMQNYSGETLILENKVLAFNSAAPARNSKPEGPPWRIAWCGVLRCKKSFELLRHFAESYPGLVEIELWGAPALDQIPDFHVHVGATPSMTFKGAYKPDDLPGIYANAHFVWAIDYYEAGGNSDWLLPNRLYEGLYFGAVPIAVAGVETARWLETRGVGVILEPPLFDSLGTFLKTCSMDKYEGLRGAATSLDPQSVAFTIDNCRALAAQLVGQKAANDA